MMQCGGYFFSYELVVEMCLSFEVAVILCGTALKQLTESVLVLEYPLIRIWNIH